MVDIFRTIHGYSGFDVLDVSHPTGDEESLSGKRFDHILASEILNPNDCFYNEAGLECSDHVLIIVDFSPNKLT